MRQGLFKNSNRISFYSCTRYNRPIRRRISMSVSILKKLFQLNPNRCDSSYFVSNYFSRLKESYKN